MPDTIEQYTFNSTFLGETPNSVAGTLDLDLTTGQLSGSVTTSTPDGGQNFTLNQVAPIGNNPEPGSYLYTVTGSEAPNSGSLTISFSPLGNPFSSGPGPALTYIDYTPPPTGGAINGGLGYYYAGSLNATETAVCFAAGTLIRTVRGEVAVEALRVGDRVITARGAACPIVWLGHRTLDCRNVANPRAVLPIRVAADAFGDGLPERDLWLSPGHSICVTCVDEVLVNIGALVNGATIAREPVDTVEYWHVELGHHDVLFANGMPAESYIDMGNRGFFADGGTPRGDVADRAHLTTADYCRPFLDGGPVLAAVRDRLCRRAEALGWREHRDLNWHLLVDGVAQVPMGEAGRFTFGDDARVVRLISDVFVPNDVADSAGDGRRLGVCVTGLVLSDGVHAVRRIALDDPRLAGSFHRGEAEAGVSWRWTDGDAVLPPELWAGMSGMVTLELTVAASGVRGWVREVAGPRAGYRAAA